MKNAMFGRTWWVFAAVMLWSASSVAENGKLPVETILQKMEKELNGFTDQTMSVRLTVVDVGGSTKNYDFTIYQKGDDKRLIRFTSGEFIGMATLIEGSDRIYVYLPGFKKVRRVAAHNMTQSFAGSDFSNEDMSTVSWTSSYTATLDREDDTHWYLNCVPKPGTDISYARAIVKINKQSFFQDGVEYFNKSGEKVKVFENGNPTKFAGGMRNKNVLVTDPRTGHKTMLEVKDFRANQGLSDQMFTVRQLEWGR